MISWRLHRISEMDKKELDTTEKPLGQSREVAVRLDVGSSLSTSKGRLGIWLSRDHLPSMCKATG